MQIFKIRSKKTGLFAKGGAYPSFSKKGKTWKRLSDVSLHFNNLGESGIRHYIEQDVEVLTFEVIEEPVDITPVQEWIAAIGQRKAAREAAAKARHEAWVREYELKQLRELQQKYSTC